MTFKSYSQNFEDVMLWRALKHVSKGFYIDVGANDPDFISVTKAFYDKGWRGINIEPVSQWFDKLKELRPEDINLKVAAGATTGEIEMFEFTGTGLSTINHDIATRHSDEQGFAFHSIKVPVDTLSRIVENQRISSPIHFIKIDVEGAEYEVLKGLDFKRIRPWIILIESTLPCSSEASHKNWDHIVSQSGYNFVYFDGLNRFYVANEHSELESAFSHPPSVLDNFELESPALIKNHLDRISKMDCIIGSQKSELSSLTLKVKDVEGKNDTLKFDLAEKSFEVEEFKSHRMKFQQRIDEYEKQNEVKNVLLHGKQKEYEKINEELKKSLKTIKNHETDSFADRALLIKNMIEKKLSKIKVMELNSKLRFNENMIEREMVKSKKVTNEYEHLSYSSKQDLEILNELESQQRQMTKNYEELIEAHTVVVERVYQLEKSISWRITAPLRYLVSGLLFCYNAPFRSLENRMRRVLGKPNLAYRMNKNIVKLPFLHRLLINFAKRRGFYINQPSSINTGDLDLRNTSVDFSKKLDEKESIILVKLKESLRGVKK